MARYIDADKIQQAIKDYGKGAIADGKNTLDVVDDILYIAGLVDFVPTADVVKVVRCADCIYRTEHHDSSCNIRHVCNRRYKKSFKVNLRDYCSLGEKESETNA